MQILIAFLFLFSLPALADRVDDAWRNSGDRLKRELEAKGLQLGNKVYFRSFKKNRINDLVNGTNVNHNKGKLEVWVEDAQGKMKLFKSYPVCAFSGRLGPKTREGDLQTPEGFYSVTRFNPQSNYHLAFDIGYPNQRDRALGNTGSSVMVHSKCESMGCLAVGETSNTDHSAMEEIYLLALEAQRKGQRNIPVHVFPFPMTEAFIQRHAHLGHERFWRELKPAYDYFEANKLVPTVSVTNNAYRITDAAGSLVAETNYVNQVLATLGASAPSSAAVNTQSRDQKVGVKSGIEIEEGLTESAQ
jgi:murein L,D-transpeptidase YafK